RLPRAETILPRAATARGTRSVGAVLDDSWRGRGTRVTEDGTSTIASPSAELAQAGAAIEAHSAALKKELGVGDLVLTQILFIVGLTWIGVAGKLGPSHVVLWSLAIVLFY